MTDITAEPKKNYLQFVLPAFLGLALIYFIYLAKGALFPFILSAALAYILNPVINYFEVRGIKRSYAVIGLYVVAGLLLFTVVYLLVYFVTIELEALKDTWPVYADRIVQFVQNLNAKMVKNYPLLASLKLDQKFSHLLETVPQVILTLLPALTLLFVVPFITFFMLAGGSGIMDYLLDHLPARNVEIVMHIASRIDASLGSYLRGILLEAFVIFLIALTGLLMMGLNYSAVIAILIGISSLVPYLGAMVGAVVSSIVAYLQFGSFIVIFRLLVFFTGIRFFDDWFLQPYIMKRAVKLNPAIILLALMAGWELGGIWGVIFSIPVTCIIKEILHIAVELQETEFRWKPKAEPTRISIPYT
ncbi:MAG TPA: AI-2E family transporter [Elusimicrobiales bacterium]|nr:AI-2E family transporter [Elusimicrobiales bacterium]